MQFILPNTHPLRSGAPNTGLFWSKSYGRTSEVIRLAFTEKASHLSVRMVKDEKTGKTEKQNYFRSVPRVDSARKHCRELFELFAYFLGVEKGAAIACFRSGYMEGFRRHWATKTKSHDTPLPVFIEISQAAWDKACAAMMPVHTDLYTHMDMHYRSVMKSPKIDPELQKLIYANLYQKACAREKADRARRIEFAVQYAYEKKAQRETGRAA